MKRGGFAFLIAILVFCFAAYGLEKPTHMAINRDIATRSFGAFSLDSYLIHQLGLAKGVTEEFNQRQITEWLSEGGKTEDEPEDLIRHARGWTRNKNHFHDPMAQQWATAGLDDFFAGLRFTGQSSILWAQNQNQTPGGKWSWHDARAYYYIALTAVSKANKESYFANTFRALGQLMHLVQDASVPAHARNDIHVFYGYETWLEDIRDRGSNAEKETFASFIANPISFDQSILNSTPNPLAPLPIARIVDTGRYHDSHNPADTSSTAIGIAEYANANFFSEHTAFDERLPHPAEADTEIKDVLISDPRNASRTVTRKYHVKKGNDQYRLATVDFLYKYVTDHFLSYRYLDKPGLDGGVYHDTAQRLLPRAVGYSAGLLEYFFRGKLQVTSLPILDRRGVIAVQVKVRNMTPSQENMMNGTFALTYRYTPTGAPSDGSQDVFGQAWASADSPNAPCAELRYQEDEAQIEFVIPDPIPRTNYSSVKFTLAFRGSLGNEAGAVIGKVFVPGEITFEEEWNNGLTGNHMWGHVDFETANTYPNHGETSNTIVGDVLFKENIRYTGYWNASANVSFIGEDDWYPNFGDVLPMRITPNTSLQFKIDHMSINEIPPAPPGMTNHYQGLWLIFNNGLVLQLSTDQFIAYTPQTAYWSFEPGRIFVNNIYKIFQESGITIPPGDLYLQLVEFVQQLFELEETSPILHRQRMEVDFIRLIEEKQQEN